MEIVVLKMLFLVGLSVAQMQIGKYVYVPLPLSWDKAQLHCRKYFTDLAAITDQREENRLKNVTTGKVYGMFWIGLYFDNEYWMWSGGGRATDIPWASDQPNDIQHQKGGFVCWSKCNWPGWHNYPSSRQLPSLCINLMVMKTTETWEQALQHCRAKHTDLTSLTSETEQLLVLSKIEHDDDITERVWIGLRFLGDSWLWVDGNPLRYEAWAEGGDQDHLCPVQRRCGAFTKQGVWENWDCQDRLNFICD